MLAGLEAGQSGATVVEAAPGEERQRSSPEPAEWKARWSHLRSGMPADEALALLGRPMKKLRWDEGRNEAWAYDIRWSRKRYGVFLNSKEGTWTVLAWTPDYP